VQHVQGAVIITESSEGDPSALSDNEDDLLREDQEQWDVFDDWQKFQQRDQILKNKRRKQAAEEKKRVQEQIEREQEEAQQKTLEADIARLLTKVNSQEQTIKRKVDREQELASDLTYQDQLLNAKKSEVEDLKNKMVVFETIKHKYETKSMEANRLLKRMTELSHMNSDLQENVHD
jgi:hypothetical protein